MTAPNPLPDDIQFALDQLIAADRWMFRSGPERANREAAQRAAMAALVVVLDSYVRADTPTDAPPVEPEEGLTPEEGPEGCGDSSCVISPSSGMSTNGGCRCPVWKLRGAVLYFRRIAGREG